VVSKAAVFGLLVAAINLGLTAGATQGVLYVISWLGLATAVWGALMALFQEDMKRLLAYSSMGQLGYVVTAAATMSQLGWVASIYLSLNHLLFKGLLFLAIAGVIQRTGTRLMYKTGGLIGNMPLSFVSVLIGIIAISGVPPLSGFGSKWLMFNALIDKGWYWQAAVAFFAGAVAFLYMFRLIHTIFLGQRKLEHKDVKEASWITFVPQFGLIGLIMALSIYPRWLIDPASAMVAGLLPTDLTWTGSLAQSHLGYWDSMQVMGVVAGVFMVPLMVLLLMSLFMRIQKVKQFNIVFSAERPDRPETTHYAYHFFSFYDRALGPLVQPRATAFWSGVSEWSHTLAGALRVLYTGNGQTYALFIMIYLVGIYFIAGGVR
jgi:NADH:ubiquinone oxidoreductase subunit 5 (subunit L)/multisubunit Na+/H+ antiporter MnhA subunit